MSSPNSISAPEATTTYPSAEQFIAAEGLPAGSVYVTHEVFTPSDPTLANRGFVTDKYCLLLEPGHDGQPSRVLALGTRHSGSASATFFIPALRVEEAPRVLWNGTTIRTLSPDSHWIVIQEIIPKMGLAEYEAIVRLHKETGGEIKLLADMIASFEQIHPRHHRLFSRIAQMCVG